MSQITGHPASAFVNSSCSEYGFPGVAVGRLVVETARSGRTTIVNGACEGVEGTKQNGLSGFELSVSSTPKVNVPATVGVPFSTPSSVTSRPGGRVPLMYSKWYGRHPSSA